MEKKLAIGGFREEVLPECDAWFPAAFVHSAVCTGLVRLDGRFRLVNPAMSKLLGYSEQELLGLTLGDITHPDDREMSDRAFRRLVARETSDYQIETRHIHKSGQVIWGLLNVSPIREAEGNTLCALSQFQDITKRKRAEAKLRRNLVDQKIVASILHISLRPIPFDEMLQQSLALLLSSHELSLESKGCIFLVDGDTKELVMQAHQGLPQTLLDCCARVPVGRCLCGRAAETGKIIHVEKVDHRHEATYSGMTPHGHYCAPMVSDGQVLGILNLYVSEGHEGSEIEENFITAVADTLAGAIRRRRAEQALAEAEARYEDLYDNAPDMFATVDATTGNIVQCNQTLAEALGYGKEEIVGRPVFDVHHPDCLPEVQETFQSFLETGEVRHDGLQLNRKDGSKIDVSLKITAVRDKYGKVLFTQSAWRDITERKLAEEQAREHQAQLAHVARLGTLGEMASGIAHEINQPLTAMGTYTEACLRMMESAEVDVDELGVLMAQAAEQSFRAGEIIRRLREFVRLGETGRTTVDVNELVRDAVAFVRAEAREKTVAVRLDLADQLPTVEADAIQIEQVILNLLRNGIEAIEGANAGQGVLTIQTGPGGGGTVELSVSDTGPGMPNETASRIFDPFFTTKSNGMGLGLSISRSIVEAHGGCLWADPSGNGGATFRLTLPSDREHNRIEH